MKRRIIRVLLAILNSRWLNQSPCEYGYINNVDAFSYSNLTSEEKMRPGITVKAILEDADRFRCCPMKPTGVTLIEDDNYRDADIWDMQELRQAINPRPKAKED